MKKTKTNDVFKSRWNGNKPKFKNKIRRTYNTACILLFKYKI